MPGCSSSMSVVLPPRSGPCSSRYRRRRTRLAPVEEVLAGADLGGALGEEQGETVPAQGVHPLTRATDAVDTDSRLPAAVLPRSTEERCESRDDGIRRLPERGQAEAVAPQRGSAHWRHGRGGRRCSGRRRRRCRCRRRRLGRGGLSRGGGLFGGRGVVFVRRIVVVAGRLRLPARLRAARRARSQESACSCFRGYERRHRAPGIAGLRWIKTLSSR